IGLLMFKDGKYVKHFSIFLILNFSILLGLYMNFNSLPSNYILERIIYIILIIISLICIALYKSEFKIARILLSIVSLLSVIMFF
ncbi:MAG: hypothetical protein RSD47_07330, partial [Romboutsia sp.]